MSPFKQADVRVRGKPKPAGQIHLGEALLLTQVVQFDPEKACLLRP